MNNETYSLEQFIEDLRRLRDQKLKEQDLLAKVAPLARKATMDKRWISEDQYRVDEEQGFGSTILHVEEDQSLFIVAVSWPPGRETPPHNHGTWAIVVAADGLEENTCWERIDDQGKPGFAEIRKTHSKLLAEGEVLVLASDAIHSMQNTGQSTGLSFHVYGRHLNHTGRSQFDPVSNTERPFLVKTQ